METIEHRVMCNECGVETSFSHTDFERYRLAQTARVIGVVFVILIVTLPVLAVVSVYTAPWLAIQLFIGWLVAMKVILPKRMPIPKMGEITFPCSACKSRNTELRQDENS